MLPAARSAADLTQEAISMPHVPAVRCPALMAVLVLILFATPLAAQSGHNLEHRDHWKARYNDGTSAPERRFVVMRPGWHVFAGPSGLFWDPSSFASGAFAVSSTIFLFPEGDPDQSGSTRLDSPFGLFLAGTDLDGDTASYVSFELHKDRRFRIAEHSVGKTHDLVPWTPHDAVVALGAESSGPAQNVLAVDVREDRTMFYLNDARSPNYRETRLPRRRDRRTRGGRPQHPRDRGRYRSEPSRGIARAEIYLEKIHLAHGIPR